jgi:AhpD family alkylhydroperoxidase
LPWGSGRLALYQGYIDLLMRGDDGRLPARERELLALVTSVENRCEVCVISHASALNAGATIVQTSVTGTPVQSGWTYSFAQGQFTGAQDLQHVEQPRRHVQFWSVTTGHGQQRGGDGAAERHSRADQ